MVTELTSVKQRFGLIGTDSSFERAISTALQVATTDMSILIVGESGTGKETFPKIIHQYSIRKHQQYIAVNCGAIPEGTIDSELFGHEKGAFTGAIDSRKGYFEVADGGTIFLDEVGELPLSTQVRLLRILETGEYIKVGSSKVQKTNVRVVAATNMDLSQAIKSGKFREDLYYRLNTVPIKLPALRERKEDIYPLFLKFAGDNADKYKLEPLRLSTEALQIFENYRWPGNIRQLKNIVEQMSIIEKERMLLPDKLQFYLPEINTEKLPALSSAYSNTTTSQGERDLLFKIIFDMRREIGEIYDMLCGVIGSKVIPQSQSAYIPSSNIVESLSKNLPAKPIETSIFQSITGNNISENQKSFIEDTEEIREESLSLQAKEKELIVQALEKYNGKRKYAADELGISERTLYRKLKEYDLF